MHITDAGDVLIVFFAFLSRDVLVVTFTPSTTVAVVVSGGDGEMKQKHSHSDADVTDGNFKGTYFAITSEEHKRRKSDGGGPWKWVVQQLPRAACTRRLKDSEQRLRRSRIHP
jgi:hypothetical protein